MTPIGTLLRAAHAAGVELRVTRNEARIVVRAPVDPELLAELRERRAELAAELAAHHREPPAEAALLLRQGGER